ncbi:MAG: alpha/beta fold hydrolase [Candidatus Helarchaeota archaeon]|nr:alpha/beta fold hydrolase [Candidatus Helarchaeota archaeon]
MGFGGQSFNWYSQIPVLSREFRLIIFDNRGVGTSERPNYPYSMKHFVDDIVALLDFLKIESANVCGISMGGMIALQLVLAHPDRVKKLILLATSAFGTAVDALLRFIEQGEGLPVEQRAKTTVQILFSRNYQKKVLNDKTLWKEYMRRFTENPTTIQDFRNQANAISKHDVRERLSEIHKPTLIMVGTNDLLLPPRNSRKIAKGIPGSELVVLRGPGHGLIVEAAEEVNKKILEFIKK